MGLDIEVDPTPSFTYSFSFLLSLPLDTLQRYRNNRSLGLVLSRAIS